MRRFLISGLTATALVIGGAAYAAIPDGSGIVHGCVSKLGGGLRVVDSDKGQVCNGLESPLNWTQTPPSISFYEVTGQQDGPSSYTMCHSGDFVTGGGWGNGGAFHEAANPPIAAYPDLANNDFLVLGNSNADSYIAYAVCMHIGS